MSEDVLKKETIIENQHYIPQFYLKLFENSNHLIERLNVKENLIMEAKSKKALCVESFFYGSNTGKEDVHSQRIEKWFGGIEDSISKKLPEIIKLFLSNDKVQEDDKYEISILIAMLYLRGPVFRSKLNKMMHSGLDQQQKILSNLPKDKVEKYFRDRYTNRLVDGEIDKIVINSAETPRFNNLLHLEMINELRGFSNMVSGQEWLIYRNNSSIPFITSDNPISPERLEKNGLNTGAFMDFTYHFALSPEIHIVTKPPRDIEGKKLHKKTLINADESLILKLNIYVADKCQNQIYSSNKVPFKGISEVLIKYKELLKKAEGI